MKGAPWFKFWVSDFRGGTLEMTNSEVGAFIRLLLAQWELGSLPDDPEGLAMVACGAVSPRVLAKFKKGPDGRLRSARMEKEREGATKRSAMGAAGADARWGADRKPEAMPESCVPHAVGIPDGSADRNAEDRGQSTEDRGEKTEHTGQENSPSKPPSETAKRRAPGNTGGDAPEDFKAFWQAYPRKVGKEAALKSWAKAKRKPPIAEILAAIEAAKRSEQWTKSGGQFIPHPATWINQGRWHDEHEIDLPEFYEDPNAAF